MRIGGVSISLLVVVMLELEMEFNDDAAEKEVILEGNWCG